MQAHIFKNLDCILDECKQKSNLSCESKFVLAEVIDKGCICENIWNL